MNSAIPEREIHLVTGDTGHRILTACGIWSDDPDLPVTTDPKEVTCAACSELEAAVVAARTSRCPSTDTCRIPLTEDTLLRAGCVSRELAHDLGLCATLYAEQIRTRLRDATAERGGQP